MNSANKHHGAESGVATAQDQNTVLVSQSAHRSSDSYIIYHSL